MNKAERITFRVDESLKRESEERAKEKGMTFPDFIRWVLRREIEETKAREDLFSNEDL